MYDGYFPLAIVLILMMIAIAVAFAALPSIGARRYDPDGKLSLRFKDILKNLTNSESPPVEDRRYLEPYESGEVSRGEFGSYINIQYYVIILLFVVFDVDMILLFPWAANFYALGFGAFIETIVFLLMPLFAVYFAFKEGYMRWLK